MAVLAPSAAFAQGPQTRLALLPVGQPGSYFDLAMQPGETRSLAVDVANDGQAAIVARTYGADVYTIINGGFGARLRDEPTSGTTTWLAYPTGVIPLRAGGAIRRNFTVTVPLDAEPGEYITSIVLENDAPLRSTGAVGLDQVIRQAVAVVVTVPGQRSASVAIGAARYKEVAGRSVIMAAVENSGNIRLKPLVRLVLLDATGTDVGHASVRMDTFYAQTSTFVEMPLAAILPQGTYTLRLTVEDSVHGLQAVSAAVPLIVQQAPPSAAASQEQGQIDPAPAVPGASHMAVALGIVVVSGIAIALVWRLRSWRVQHRAT